MSRGRISYRHPERSRNITGRALGSDYEWPVIEAGIRYRAEHGRMPERLSLVTEIDEAIRAKGASYAQRVAASNVRKLSETIAFVQEAEFETRAEVDAAAVLAMKSVVQAKAALDEKEAEIRKAGRAIRAAGEYLSNRVTWRAYRSARDRRSFYVKHRRALEECNRARKILAETFPDGKVPTISEMRETKTRLERERDALYERWCEERHRSWQITTAKLNIDAVLGGHRGERAKSRDERGDLELG